MGLTVLDAGVFIGFLDGHDVHHASARVAITEAFRRNDSMVVPSSALAEALVGPSRHGEAAVTAVRTMLTRLPVEVAPLDGEIAVVAARLRARHRSLKLPDALVIATAMVREAAQLVTTDRRWPTRRSLGLASALTVL